MEAKFLSTPAPAVTPHYPATYVRNAQRIALPYLNRTVMVSVDDIVCLEGEGNYTFIHTRDRRKYLVSKTLKEFEKTLDNAIFIRIHKSNIINLAYVQHGVFARDRIIRMADNREVTISRRRMREISQLLAQYQEDIN
ncbi:LytR/AlgR family response regulator transcription factor [Fibrivirga algicola]|uniref:LytTR family transcriptional regulator n=1 Tax=Fibrivirga algicola TaxID=2950420 RepID=A0ABX0QFQ2_9BACT|nr:LytTR family DNA-binding domain-containing protein [Fibrivirga algicola]NID11261.1 LytTR family transcriptional regulator [Fibrivirga algicola]